MLQWEWSSKMLWVKEGRHKRAHISLIWNVQKRQIYIDRKIRLPQAQGGNGWGVSFWSDECHLKLDFGYSNTLVHAPKIIIQLKPVNFTVSYISIKQLHTLQIINLWEQWWRDTEQDVKYSRNDPGIWHSCHEEEEEWVPQSDGVSSKELEVLAMREGQWSKRSNKEQGRCTSHL